MFSFKNSIDIKLIAARGHAGHCSMSCEQLIVHRLFFLGFISLSLLFITVMLSLLSFVLLHFTLLQLSLLLSQSLSFVFSFLILLPLTLSVGCLAACWD